MVAKAKIKAVATSAPLLKLDLGCGKRPQEGFEGVDSRDFGQKHKVDLTLTWPWKAGSVEAVNCSHFVEHLNAEDRIHFVNELHRVLIPGGKATIVTPYWRSMRAYGDLTHQWPPVSEFWFYYLSKAWREVNAPHNDGYTCDFDITAGFSMHPAVAARPPEYQQYALANYCEAAQDLIATFVAKK